MRLVMNVGGGGPRVTQPATPSAVHNRACGVGYAHPPMTATNEARETGEHRTETISGLGHVSTAEQVHFRAPTSPTQRSCGGEVVPSGQRYD